ncbi:MAG: hypothetical protein GY855_04960, partial [candidate division Zixibacteria bacterium]|nr:hypothetical protein [candidate division Zixibacteria bacterium]
MIYFLLMSIIPAAGLTIYSSVQMTSSYTTDRLIQLGATATQKTGNLETWFSERQGDAAFLADLPTIEESTWVLTHDNYTSGNKTTAVAAAEQIMEYMIHFYGCYLEIFLVDTNGTVLAHAETDASGFEPLYDTATEGYYSDELFVEKMDLTSGNWGDPEYSFLSDFHLGSHGEVVMLAGCPMRYEGVGGSIGTGMVILRIDLTTIDALMHNTLGLGTSGETYLISEAGYWLTSSKFDYYTTETGEYSDIEDTLLTEKVTTAGIVACVAAEAQTESAANDDYRGIPVMG